MLSVSELFREAVAQSSKVSLKATLRLANGTTKYLVDDDFMADNASFSEGVSSDGSFDIGAAIIGKFDFALNNTDGRFDGYDFTNATITPYVGVVTSGTTVTWLLKGVYGIEQPSTYGPVISVSSLDNMRKFERNYSDVATTYPASLRTILRDVCSACNVTLAVTSFPNNSFSVARRPDDANMTCLDIVGYVAQAAGCWARIDTSGRLCLEWYDTSFFDWTPAPGTYADLSATSSTSVFTDDVVVTGIEVTAQDEVAADGSRGNGGETYKAGSDGYVIAIDGNPLVQYGNAETIAKHIASRTVGMRFRPFDVSAMGNPAVQAGDPAIITDPQGRTYNSYITSLTYKVGARESYSCGAEYPGRNLAKRYSAAAKTYAKTLKLVEREQTARELAIENLAKQITDSSGLFMTVEPQQDGSSIYYMHDQPSLAESEIVWKLTANAFGISTDGGQTYPYGLDTNGDALLNRIYAIGLDADYIDTGRIEVKKGGKTLFMVDMDTGQFILRDEAGNNSWDSQTGLVATGFATKDDVDSISVGGTNLLLDSNHSALTKRAADANRYWSIKDSASTNTIISLSASARPVGGASYAANIAIKSNMKDKYSGIAYYAYKGVKMLEGQKYTISCWARRSGGTADIKFQYGQTSYKASKRLALTTAWKRYSFTFTFKQSDVGGTSGARVYFYTFASSTYSSTVQIAGMKLEIGTKATDWSAAPEDTEVSVATAVADAKTYTNAITKLDREYTDQQRKALDDSLTQQKIAQRLFRYNSSTGKYAVQGVVIQNGQLYINGRYIQTNTLSAGIIKTGLLMDQMGKTKLNLETGYMYTRNAEFENCNVTGWLTSGYTNKAQFNNGSIRFFNDRKNALTIDGALYFKDGNYGAHVTFPKYLVFRGPDIAVDDRTTGCGTKGKTFCLTVLIPTVPGAYGTLTPNAANDNGWPDTNPGTWNYTRPTWKWLSLKFVNGICVGASLQSPKNK